MSTHAAKIFIQRVRNGDSSLRDELYSLSRNDWKGVSDIGRRFDLDFSPDEIQSVIPEDFFFGHGKNPQLGWDRVQYE